MFLLSALLQLCSFSVSPICVAYSASSICATPLLLLSMLFPPLLTSMLLPYCSCFVLPLCCLHLCCSPAIPTRTASSSAFICAAPLFCSYLSCPSAASICLLCSRVSHICTTPSAVSICATPLFLLSVLLLFASICDAPLFLLYVLPPLCFHLPCSPVSLHPCCSYLLPSMLLPCFSYQCCSLCCYHLC
jgi:hypothetical protein